VNLASTAPSAISPYRPPDYGLDAPGVVRNLFVAAAAGALLTALAALRIWSGRLTVGPIGGVTLAFPLARMGGWTGAGCLVMGLWMVWTSRVGKVRGRERLLDLVPWRGSERVLDVGCGRGLLLIGAARRLTTGRAIGIDLWQGEDLSGNRPEATLENARLEGVADRVEVKTGDMRALPFEDASFDVVVSSAAIHNVYQREGRGKAIAEIARVLAHGGRAVIDDIRHAGEYAGAFRANGCSDVRREGSWIAAAFLAAVTFGALRPATLVVRKDEERVVRK
jgi:arsenite methyltransferase